MSDSYEQGRQDRRAFTTSNLYAQFDPDISARDAMRLFMPPVPEDLMQVQRPLPPRWANWCKGWEDEACNT